MRITLCLALVLAAATARAEERLDGGQVHQGFALELHIGSELFSFGTGTGTASAFTFSGLQGGIFAGYKIGRIVAGLAFDLARSASGMSVPGADTDQATTAILFSPGIRVAIVRSSDERVELFGEFDIGFGHTFTEQNPSPTGPQPDKSNFHLAYQIGPGVRFWAHPHFAISGLAGVEGQFEFDSETDGSITTKSSTGVTSIFAALQLLGVF